VNILDSQPLRELTPCSFVNVEWLEQSVGTVNGCACCW